MRKVRVEMPEEPLAEMEAELVALEEELAERRAALPAHSLRPHQLQEIEELEDRIRELRQKIDALKQK